MCTNCKKVHCGHCKKRKSLQTMSTLMRPVGLAAIGCRCARKVSTGRFFGPTGPQHSLKCQIVLLTREKIQLHQLYGERGNNGGEKTRRETEPSAEERRFSFPSRKSRTLRKKRGDLNEGMPKRRPDKRPEHQT